MWDIYHNTMTCYSTFTMACPLITFSFLEKNESCHVVCCLLLGTNCPSSRMIKSKTMHLSGVRQLSYRCDELSRQTCFVRPWQFFKTHSIRLLFSILSAPHYTTLHYQLSATIQVHSSELVIGISMAEEMLRNWNFGEFFLYSLASWSCVCRTPTLTQQVPGKYNSQHKAFYNIRCLDLGQPMWLY